MPDFVVFSPLDVGVGVNTDFPQSYQKEINIQINTFNDSQCVLHSVINANADYALLTIVTAHARQLCVCLHTLGIH